MGWDAEFVQRRFRALLESRLAEFREAMVKARGEAESGVSVNLGDVFGPIARTYCYAARDKLASSYLAYCKSWMHDPADDIRLVEAELNWFMTSVMDSQQEDHKGKVASYLIQFKNDWATSFDAIAHGWWSDELVYDYVPPWRVYLMRYVWPPLSGGVAGFLAAAWKAYGSGVTEFIRHIF